MSRYELYINIFNLPWWPRVRTLLPLQRDQV